MMARAFSAQLLSLARYLRWFMLLGVVLSCLGLAHLTGRVRQEAPMPLDRNNSLVRMREFRSEVDADGIRVRVLGEALVVSQATLAGPFRLGFAYALVGRNITLELFPQDTPLRAPDKQPAPIRQFLTSLAPSLSHLLFPAVPEQSGITLAQAECGPLTILSHEGAETLVVFSAERCRTNFGLTKVHCTEGVIRRGESTLSFQELTYTGRHWKLLTVDGQSQEVDELPDLDIRE